MEAELSDDPDWWREFANCRDMGTSLFFGSRMPWEREEAGRTDRVKRAKAICAECVVRAECLEYAMVRIEFGIAGGLTERERKKLRAQRRRSNGKQEG